MSAKDVEILMTYRLEQADEALRVADMLLVSCVFRTVVNRAYYAMCYAVLALLAARQFVEAARAHLAAHPPQRE